jgi:pyruvate kinase
VRNAHDIAVVRGVCEAARARIPILSKIEKHEAVSNIDEILAASDGIMVARGDLGVEIPIDEVPVVQKMIIKKCNAAGKPVITATQMLDSMIRNPRPTRAEASDVANAIYDGADAVMLSGETAVGAYPLQAVAVMDRIACYTEGSLRYQHHLPEGAPQALERSSITRAIAQATCDVAQDLGAVAIITATSSGNTAKAVSRFRPGATIIAATSRPEVRNRLALVWGVYPLLVPNAADSDSMMRWCLEAAHKTGLVNDGDIVVLTGGVPVNLIGQTNFLRVHRMGAPISLSDTTGG